MNLYEVYAGITNRTSVYLLHENEITTEQFKHLCKIAFIMMKEKPETETSVPLILIEQFGFKLPVRCNIDTIARELREQK